MKFLTPHQLSVIVLGAGLLMGAASASATQYSVTKLDFSGLTLNPTVPEVFSVSDINEQGQIVGNIYSPALGYKVTENFVSDAHGANIRTWGGPAGTSPNEITNEGKIFGVYTGSNPASYFSSQLDGSALHPVAPPTGQRIIRYDDSAPIRVFTIPTFKPGYQPGKLDFSTIPTAPGSFVDGFPKDYYRAYDTNKSGQVVGSFYNGNLSESDTRAFVTEAGAANPMLVDHLSFTNFTVPDTKGYGFFQSPGIVINDAGQFIVTSGNRFNSDAAYLISPVSAVPEPTSVALMLAGLGLVGAASRRRMKKNHSPA